MTTENLHRFDAQSAEGTLRAACTIVGFTPGKVELLRLGDHALFRMHGGQIVSRVGRHPDRLPSVGREVAIAHWLSREEYPAVRLAVTAEQPVAVHGHPVTFWEGLVDGEEYASTREMGSLLRRLHALEAPPASLPELRPFDKVGRRLRRAEIGAEARSYLTALATDLATSYDRLDFALPRGHVHGDFNVGNVLRDSHGQPHVIDLDGFAVGPREWDLTQTAMYYESFGWHTADEYAGFAAAYGFDVRKWPGYPVLRSVRELLMITWLAQNAGTDPRASEEVAKRIATLREGGSRRKWAPF
ncbi:phosphotransferase enzyme family protein [Streptomyces sp. NPDC059740]|uniref:phosphotransferase enzyme family protein n=1 Tax=Streptomyces sp. NPDC059740 TaxID=3346926 RepID=UPI003652ED75